MKGTASRSAVFVMFKEFSSISNLFADSECDLVSQNQFSILSFDKEYYIRSGSRARLTSIN